MAPTDDQIATILFADLLGFDELARARGPDEAFAIVTRCLQRLDEVARRNGGAVDKYLGDCLMAVFGFPVASPHPEAAAVAAAHDMLQAVEDTRQELGLDPGFALKVGINTGSILAGDVGGSVIREFAVIGDAVNVAARLKDLAPPGHVWVGPETHSGARARFRFDAEEIHALKGRQKAVQPFALARSQDAGRHIAPEFCPLFGRDVELHRLEERLTALAGGVGGVVWVHGEPGVGKSRLIDASLEGRDALRIVRVRRADPARDLPPVTTRSPSVVILEEAGRVGAEALATLAEWLPTCLAAPVLLVVASREVQAPALRALHDQAQSFGERFEDIGLAGLSDADLNRLIEAVAGDQPLAPEVRRLLLTRSRGNPSRAIQGVFLADALAADAARAGEHEERADEAERRRTTVLFADLSGFTRLAEVTDHATLHEIVASGLDRMSAVARRHGGTVEKYLGDCVLAVFGAPVAIEDAPRAAVNAAIEIRDEVAAFNRERELDPPLAVHTGIDTGLGIAGDVSGPMIREFTLLGASVGRASRLKDASPSGEIWVGPETWRATREAFEYDPVSDPGSDAHAVRSTEARLHRDRARRGKVASALVGRRRELRGLAQAVGELSGGTGGFAAVVGEAGLGKSRLVEEWLGALPEGTSWLKGRSLSIGRNLAFHPFADLLARWCGIDESDDEEASLARLQEAANRLLEEESADTVPFLATLMGLPAPESERERLERLGADAMQKLILGAVTRVLRRLAESGPHVLVFEDLHWADLSSIELLESLLHVLEESAILVVGVFRPHHADTSDRILAAARERLGEATHELELAPLPEDAALEMLRNLFRGGDVPPTLLAAVRERAHGNPFFVEEVVRSLLDAGVLVERRGALEATARIETVEIPGTLQEVVMARVDALSRPPREVLRAASVIGGAFQQAVVEEVVGKDDLPELLEALVAAELLTISARTGEYRFKHPLIQEVVYDTIVSDRREALHREIGHAIEARVSDVAPGYHAMLAYHFTRGRDARRAEAYLFRAGDEAARAAAPDEALRFFREASAVFIELHGESGDPEKMAVLERSIAMALANRGHYVEAIDHFDEALRHRGVEVTDDRVRLALRLVRDLVVVLTRLYVPAVRRDRPPATEEQKAVQELIYDRARAQTTSAPDRYLFDWMDGLRRLDGADPTTMPLAGGQFASTVGIFSYGGVSFAVSERFLKLARDLVDPDDAEERMVFGFMNAFHDVLSGRWSDQNELPDEFVRDRIRNGQLFDVTNYLAFAAEKRICQGRFEEAIAVMERLEEIADLYQYDLALSSLHGLTAFLYLEQGLWEDAVEAADRHYTQHDDPLLNILALGTRAKAEIHAGDPDAAARSLESAERLLASATGVVPPYQKSAVLRSRLLLELDALRRDPGRRRRARARRAARAALRSARRVACRRPEVYALEAMRHALSGKHRRAERWLTRARAEAERLDMQPTIERMQEKGVGLLPD